MPPVILAAGRYDRSGADVYVLPLDALAVGIPCAGADQARRAATNSASHPPTPTSPGPWQRAVSAPPPGPRHCR